MKLCLSLVLVFLLLVHASSAYQCPSSALSTASVESVRVYLSPYAEEVVSFTLSTPVSDASSSLTLSLEMSHAGVAILRSTHGLQAVSGSATASVLVTETLPAVVPNGLILARALVTDAATGAVVACTTFEITERQHANRSILDNDDDDALWNDNDVQNHNQNGNNSWTAARNSYFAGKTLGDVRQMLGTIVTPAPKPTSSAVVVESAVDVATVPASFSSATQWPKCATIISTIRDQGQCGSCWAFSAVEVLADRACIATAGADTTILSPQDLVSCNTANYGCNGGYLNVAWTYLTNTGVESEAQFPYSAATHNNGVTGSCGSHASVHPRTYAKSVTTYTGVANMQAAIQANGPIQVAFTVVSDFMNYSSGVYIPVSKTVLGGHAVKAVGWGVTAAGVQYWIMNNQWTTGWGMKGVFWIRRGHNDCGIETSAYAGLYSKVQ